MTMPDRATSSTGDKVDAEMSEAEAELTSKDPAAAAVELTTDESAQDPDSLVDPGNS